MLFHGSMLPKAKQSKGRGPMGWLMVSLSSPQILPMLYEAGNAPHQSGKLQHKLECLVEEASQTCGREIQAIMQAVLDAAHNLCPPMVQKSGARDQLVNAMSERIHLQEHLSLSAVLDQMVTDVFSKLKWVLCLWLARWGWGLDKLQQRDTPFLGPVWVRGLATG